MMMCSDVDTQQHKKNRPTCIPVRALITMLLPHAHAYPSEHSSQCSSLMRIQNRQSTRYSAPPSCTATPLTSVVLCAVSSLLTCRLITTGYPLREAWAVWNVLLSVFSIIGATRTVPVLLHKLTTEGLFYTACTDPEEWYLNVSSLPHHCTHGLDPRVLISID
jgi:hypothetical protein